MTAPPCGSVRRMAAWDVDRVAELWAGVADHHGRLDPLFTLRSDAEARIRALIRMQLRDRDAAIFVWESGGDIRGFCSVRIDRAPPIFDEVERAEIGDLGVRENARRRGIARALVDRALAWVAERGVRRVEVRVVSRNAEGQAFWRALGFVDWMDVLQRRL